MTRMFCSIFLAILMVMSVSSCSLFESDEDRVNVGDIDNQSVSADADDLEDDIEDNADDDLGSSDDDFDEESDDEFADDDSDEDLEEDELDDDLKEENIDQQLVNDELDDFQEEQPPQEAAEDFIVDAEQEPVIDEPAPEQPIVDIPAADNEVTNLAYKSFENGGTVVIETATPATYQVREEMDRNQIIVEVENVKLPKRFKRPYVTKDFKQDIATINAYQDDGSTTARFIIQLKKPMSPTVQQEGSSILVLTNEPQMMAQKQKPMQRLGGTMGLPDSSNTLGKVDYRGEKMSFEVAGADIRDVIQNIAAQSGVNLVMDSDVSGKVNLRLRDVPWDQALMVLLKTNGLGYVKEGNVLRIAKQKTLSDEAQQISKQIESEKRARELAGGIKVKYIPVSYADVVKLEQKLKSFSSKQGKITHDERTSSIVITDYEEYIARMTKLVTALDIPPLQVEIESKLIEAREEFVREAGINWGMSGQEFNIGGGRVGTINANSNPLEAQSVVRGMTLDLSVGTFDVFGDLTAALGLFERQNKIKVLSQPKVQTLNKAEAVIQNVTQIPIKQITNIQGAVTETIQFQDLILLLKVKPQITFRGDVIMDVELKREFAGTAVEDGQRELNKRSAKTTVMVKNGKTAVIGGIYQLDDSDGDQGIPWLKDIPIVGYLFKQVSQEKRKSELLLFLKPKILKDDNEALVSKLDVPEDTEDPNRFEEMSVDEGSFDDSSFEEGETF